MLLAATEKGIGSLWICDIYFAYSELCKWVDSDGQLIAAIAFGYPNEFPKERPRKKIDDMFEIPPENTLFPHFRNCGKIEEAERKLGI